MGGLPITQVLSERRTSGIAVTFLQSERQRPPQLTSFKSILHYIDVTLTISTNFFLYFVFYLDVFAYIQHPKTLQILIVQIG